MATDRSARPAARRRRRSTGARVGVAVRPGCDWRCVVRLAIISIAVVFVTSRLIGLLDQDQPPLGIAGVPTVVADMAPDSDRTVDVHAGYATWVDVYDYLPSDGSGGSGTPNVTPASLDGMARRGVRTLYLQAAQFDESATGALADPALLGEFLVRAHRFGMRVVGWYLPRFTDVDRDLEHLVAISDFEALGHRFDGVAVDIEWTAGVPDHAARSDELVDLSERLRDVVGDDALGAIVLPPVQLEVINPQKWPRFPWRRLAGLYDVWLPMGYWTERRADSGYQDGWTYTVENVRRLRADLDDPDAVVHAIGGIGDRVTSAQAARFVEAVGEVDAIGASIYDWSTLDPQVSTELAAGLERPPQKPRWPLGRCWIGRWRAPAAAWSPGTVGRGRHDVVSRHNYRARPAEPAGEKCTIT